MVKFSYSGYFTSFSWGAVILAMLLSFVGLLVLTALSFLYSTVTSTSFVTLVLTVVTYLIGQSLADVKALVEAPEAVGITVSPLMKMVVEVAYYVLPNLSYFDTKTQAAHGVFIGWTSVFATVGYGLVYVVLSLSAAVIFFRRREFP